MIEINKTVQWLKTTDISCIKYHFSTDKSAQNMDAYPAILRLSDEGDQLILDNLKPLEFTNLEKQDGSEPRKKEENLIDKLESSED